MEKELQKISAENGAFYADMAILANSQGKLLTTNENGEPVLQEIKPEKSDKSQEED